MNQHKGENDLGGGGELTHARANSIGKLDSKHSLIKLMNAFSQGVLIYGTDFRPLFVNKHYAQSLGYTIDSIMALEGLDAIYSAEEKMRLNQHRQNHLEKTSSEPLPYNVEIGHRNGQCVVLQHSISVIEWDGCLSTLVFTIDVTQQIQSRKALQLSEERFRDFAESASDWCWEMDEALCFVYISDSFERISGANKDDVLGLTRQQFMSKNIHAIHISEHEKRAWKEHWEQLAHREPFSNFEYNWYRPDGSAIIISASGKPICNDKGLFCGYRGTARNITIEKRLSEKLSFQATHDELTGLINRRHFDNELHNAMDDVHVNNATHVLVFMDLDRFKIVNDTSGHMAGDELLQQLSTIFQRVFSKRDVLGRLGGDEFAVIMRNCTVEQSMRTTSRLHDEIDRFRFVWDGKSFTIGISIGVASIDKNSDSVSKLLQNVDSACYVAKESGRNRTHVFSENDEDLSKRQGEMHWAARITQALEEDAFTLHGQAITPLDGSEGVFYELLIRMRDGDELISPKIFLPAAERYDLSLNIDRWVLRKALEWIHSNAYVLSNTQLIFINLSAKTISKRSFQDYAVKQLQDHGVPPEKICFEITETTAIANLAEAVGFIDKLKSIGCYFALDDFGSGVSSFAYLKNLPVDYLKIDGMFIRNLHENEVNLAMVKSINDISHVMGKKTIAEFVEDEATLSILTDMGIDYAQGYLLGKPLPLEGLVSIKNTG